MADIGSKLRETRIRNKIDITTVEQATKIRAKYLRALENEEWRVLPGSTYVKTFLRTYAQFLGLDAHLLVEEYSALFERPEELEVPAFTREGPVRQRVQRVGPPSRWTFALGILVAFIGFLLVLGLTGGGDDKGRRDSSRASSSDRDGSDAAPAAPAVKERKKAAAKSVRLEVVAARPVWVCVVDGKGRPRVDARTLGAGQHEGPFKSSSFTVTVGNGGGDLKLNGRMRDTPDRAEPIGYLVKPAGTRELAADKRPTCE